MTPPATIRVTADHIAKGTRRDSRHCPIACAIREQWPDATVDVPGEHAVVLDAASSRFFQADFPDEACEFVQFFDHSQDAHLGPFEFAVEWTALGGAS